MAFDVSNLPQARQLTPEEYAQCQLEADELVIRLASVKERVRECAWDLAHVLYDIEEASAWVFLGQTREQWLEGEGVTLRTHQRYVQAWRELVVLRHLDAPSMARLDISKVDIALPALKAGRATAAEVIEDVESFTQRELREKYQDKPALPPVIQLAPPTPADDHPTSTPTPSASCPDVCASSPAVETEDELSGAIKAGRALVVDTLPDIDEVGRVAAVLREHATDSFLCHELIALLDHFGALADDFEEVAM